MSYMIHIAPPGTVRINANEREEEGRVRRAKKRKGIEVQKADPPNPSRASMRTKGVKSRTENRGEQEYDVVLKTKCFQSRLLRPFAESNLKYLKKK